jgi:hypothetical protein
MKERRKKIKIKNGQLSTLRQVDLYQNGLTMGFDTAVG